MNCSIHQKYDYSLKVIIACVLFYGQEKTFLLKWDKIASTRKKAVFVLKMWSTSIYDIQINVYISCILLFELQKM